jgi:hypothetical protein
MKYYKLLLAPVSISIFTSFSDQLLFSPQPLFVTLSGGMFDAKGEWYICMEANEEKYLKCE